MIILAVTRIGVLCFGGGLAGFIGSQLAIEPCSHRDKRHQCVNMVIHAACLVCDFGTRVSCSVLGKVADAVVKVGVGSSWH